MLKRCFCVISSLILVMFLFTSCTKEEWLTSSTKHNLPNNDYRGIVVNDQGIIYLGNQDEGQIDVFNNSGECIYHLSCKAEEGAFDINIDKNNMLLIGVARSELLLTYDKQGSLISSVNDPGAYERIGDKYNNEFQDTNGNVYKIISPLGKTQIVKQEKNGFTTIILTISNSDFLWKVSNFIFLTLLFIAVILFSVINFIKHVTKAKSKV